LDKKNNIAKKVRSAQKGDRAAMQFLYKKFAREMLTLSYRITDNLPDSEDIIQESFIHAFNVLSQLKNKRYFGTWLKRIVLNNSLKKIKKRQSYADFDQVELIQNEEPSKWYESIPSEVVQEAIQNLPDGCREILTLYLLDNYKHREIALILEISISTSKSQYQYGLKMLRNSLKKHANV